MEEEVEVNLTEIEWAMIRRYAEAEGLTMAEFFRSLLYNYINNNSKQ